MSELRPCPFCGSPAQHDVHYMIECPECSAAITGSEDLPERWNRRTPGPATRAMLEELKDGHATNLAGPDVNSVGYADYLLKPEDVKAFIAEWEDQ